MGFEDINEDTELTLSIPEAGRKVHLGKNASYAAARRGEMTLALTSERALLPEFRSKGANERITGNGIFGLFGEPADRAQIDFRKWTQSGMTAKETPKVSNAALAQSRKAFDEANQTAWNGGVLTRRPKNASSFRCHKARLILLGPARADRALTVKMFKSCAAPRDVNCSLQSRFSSCGPWPADADVLGWRVAVRGRPPSRGYRLVRQPRN